MLDMKGAHMDHKSRHDGAFFMAPNKMHHLEGKYSERCGFQLHLFNAFTKPISVERFRAFITVIPSHDHEAEITRFLEPNKDRTVMTARVGATVTRPFKIELHLKFPEADDPELFSIHVPALAKIAKTPTKALGNVIDVKIEKRKIVGKQVIRITQEETVTLRWSTDEAVQLHLHGYDIEKAVKPGTQTLMTIKAHAAGRFPVTTHGFGNDAHGGHSKNNLLYLEVYPK